MRLIDIDKHFELNEPFYKADIEMPLHRVKVALESLPTVQAIPIDWLVAKAKEKVLSQGKKFYSLLDLPIVYDLIEEWKKENESY